MLVEHKNDTAKMTVNVETAYLAQHSDPNAERYVFTYTITIKNSGQIPARVIGRHWIITDANGNIQEVRGPGVAGEQPFLNPGELFRYTSGTILSTPVGCMHGSYQMISHDGEPFETDIPAFRLAQPNTLH